jgi:hypothetical protein
MVAMVEIIMRSVRKRTLAVLMFLGLTLSACPLISFLSDRIVYEFSGTVIGSTDHRRIASVSVIASCEKARLDPPHETLSNENGEFTLWGNFWGTLDGCQLRFEHPQFKSKMVKLEASDKIAQGLMRIWKVNVELEPL